MKKLYISPAIEYFDVRPESALLDGSPDITVGGDNGDGNGVGDGEDLTRGKGSPIWGNSDAKW